MSMPSGHSISGAKAGLPSSHCSRNTPALAISSASVTGGRLVSIAGPCTAGAMIPGARPRPQGAAPSPESPDLGVERPDRTRPAHPPVDHLHALAAQPARLLLPGSGAGREGDPPVAAQHP